MKKYILIIATILLCVVFAEAKKSKYDDAINALQKEITSKYNDFEKFTKSNEYLLGLQPQILERKRTDLVSDLFKYRMFINSIAEAEPEYNVSSYMEYYNKMQKKIGFEIAEEKTTDGNTLQSDSNSSDGISRSGAPKNSNEEITRTVSSDGSSRNGAHKKSNEEITLTVSSDGPTKDDALKNALRSAIEQAFGAFVSANTTILNDELVKDEIVTVSNGSIKDYKEVTSYEKTDGSGYVMTVNATVSLPHLITYAKNHGSECEFAGNTFGMELKLFKLQKENELKALYNSIPVIVEFAKNNMRHDLTVSEPQIVSIDFSYDIRESEKYGNKWVDGGRFSIEQDDFQTNLMSIANEQIKTPYGENCQKNDLILNEITKIANEENLLVRFDIKWHPGKKDNTGPRRGEVKVSEMPPLNKENPENPLGDYIRNLLLSLSIDENSYEKYRSQGHHPFPLDVYVKPGYHYETVFLRNSQEDFNSWIWELCVELNKVKNSFAILDNTGTYSDFASEELAMIYFFKDFLQFHDPICQAFEQSYQNIQDHFQKLYYITLSNGGHHWLGEYYTFHNLQKAVPFNSDRWDRFSCYGGSGLFSKIFSVHTFRNFYMRNRNEKRATLDPYSLEDNCSIYALIPSSEIGKYSSFKIYIPEEN